MTSSKLSSKVLLLVGAIGLSVATFAGAASATVIMGGMTSDGDHVNCDGTDIGKG